MDFTWNTTFIKPDNLISISKGEKGRMLKYLSQFLELIPQRKEDLIRGLENHDRSRIRQILHQMSPQLLFFGVPDVEQPIKRLEQEYQSIPMEELRQMVQGIIQKLEGATREVEMVLKNHFE